MLAVRSSRQTSCIANVQLRDPFQCLGRKLVLNKPALISLKFKNNSQLVLAESHACQV